jgi:molecular chaperone GrpE
MSADEYTSKEEGAGSEQVGPERREGEGRTPNAPAPGPTPPPRAPSHVGGEPGETSEGAADAEPLTPEEAPEPEPPPAQTDDPDPQQSAEEHQHRVEQDLEELEARAQKADEYLELAQRTRADFENFRKRAAREAAAAQERGIAKLAKELLPAVDNLDRALAAVPAYANGGAEPAEEGTLATGVKLVQQELLGALARVGIESFSPEGEQFDPQCHEAMAQHPADGTAPGTILEVYQRGYRIGETVLRPARVVVAGG